MYVPMDKTAIVYSFQFSNGFIQYRIKTNENSSYVYDFDAILNKLKDDEEKFIFKYYMYGCRYEHRYFNTLEEIQERFPNNEGIKNEFLYRSLKDGDYNKAILYSKHKLKKIQNRCKEILEKS